MSESFTKWRALYQAMKKGFGTRDSRFGIRDSEFESRESRVGVWELGVGVWELVIIQTGNYLPTISCGALLFSVQMNSINSPSGMMRWLTRTLNGFVYAFGSSMVTSIFITP